MPRRADERNLIPNRHLLDFGVEPNFITEAINYVYEVLDRIDVTLLDVGSQRLSQLLELANLSAIVGNLFRGGITHASRGAFKVNAPHTYPDLIGVADGCKDLEIKVALETNKPKGHLVKPGPHLTVRYVLVDERGNFSRGKAKRGEVVCIWEIRAGVLREGHFNFSSTEGDSGKTAVINSEGMRALELTYCDLHCCPYSDSSPAYQEASEALRRGSQDTRGTTL